MKTLLRNLLINVVAVYGASTLIPGFTYMDGYKGLILGALGLMVVNLAIVPLLKIMFLPLNLLTFGFFTWVINVIALYILTSVLPYLKLMPFYFPGTSINGFMIPPLDLNVLHVAIVASFLIGLISNFLHWLTK